jgi:hypothetical protein
MKKEIKSQPNTPLFVVTVNSEYFVRYKHEILVIKYAKPNHTVHYIRVFVITEFNCNRKGIYKIIEGVQINNILFSIFIIELKYFFRPEKVAFLSENLQLLRYFINFDKKSN